MGYFGNFFGAEADSSSGGSGAASVQVVRAPLLLTVDVSPDPPHKQPQVTCFVGDTFAQQVWLLDADRRGVPFGAATVTATLTRDGAAVGSPIAVTAKFAEEGIGQFVVPLAATDSIAELALTVTRDGGAGDVQTFGPVALSVRRR